MFIYMKLEIAAEEFPEQCSTLSQNILHLPCTYISLKN